MAELSRRAATLIAAVLASAASLAPTPVRAAPDDPCAPGGSRAQGAGGALRRPTITGCRETAPLSAAPRVEVRTVRVPAPPVPVDLRPTPSPGLARAEHRLLLLEIARLERLLERTPRRDPGRAAIVLRLAEDYAELARRSGTAKWAAEAELEATVASPALRSGSR